MQPVVTAPAVCALDFAIDTIVLAHQPLSVRLVSATPVLSGVGSGRRLGARTRGQRVVAQWGEAFVTAEAVEELRARLASGIAHAVSFNEPDGSIVSLNVVAEALRTVWRWDVPGFYEAILLTFWERGS